MVFSSVTFLYFVLPCFLLVYLIAPWRNLVLLGASLFFYAWGEGVYVLLLLGSISLNYAAGLAIDRLGPRGARWMLGGGIAANLLLLGVFKYANFAFETLAPLLPDLELEPMHFPIGISFFTFQAMSYLVDVQRGHARAERSPLVLANYISMFPQLVAGPIVRFHTIQAELHRRTVDLGKFERGIRFFVVGLGQKVLIANTLAVPVDAIFGTTASDLTPAVAWLGAVCYTLQIYFDFAGYSNMAIGLGLMLGFHLPVNFDYPYTAQSITDFWRRWHISLSTWFRDYLYIPLGGNRRGGWRTYANLIIVFVLCGLWHGASFGFLVWGLYHGAFLVAERMGLAALLARLWRPLRHAYAIVVVVVGFVIFRADTLPHAGQVLLAMGGLSPGDARTQHVDLYLRANVVVVLVLAALGSAPVLPAVGRWLALRTRAPRPAVLRTFVRSGALGALAAVLLLCAMSLAAGTHNPFIYFRF